MDEFRDDLRELWLAMLEPPWRHSDDVVNMAVGVHWWAWISGWIWTLAGLVLGAFIAPLLLERAGLANTAYGDALDIGGAVVLGFLVQFVGWLIFLTGYTVFDLERSEWFFYSVLTVISVLPIAGVGYGLYRYFAGVGASQRSITIAFVGSLLIKTFLIPFIKGLVTGVGFKWFMKWLHGSDVRTSKPDGSA